MLDIDDNHTNSVDVGPQLFEHNKMVVIDIWGGLGYMDHLARFIRGLEEALNIARFELLRGYLVNLRSDIAWGSSEEFDDRNDMVH